MLNPYFFEIRTSVDVIRIKSGYPVSLVLSYVIATHISTLRLPPFGQVNANPTSGWT